MHRSAPSTRAVGSPWLAALVGAVLLLTGCSGQGGEPDAAASSSPVVPSTSPSASEDEVRQPVGGTSRTERAECRDRQASAVVRLEWPFVQHVWRVMAAVSGRAPLASTAMRSRVVDLWARVRGHCRGPGRPAMADFVRTVRQATSAPLDRRRLERVLAAYSAWAHAVNAPDNLDEMTADLAYCERLERRVRTGYAVWWEPTSYGRKTWVQMIVHNDTDHRLWFELSGTLRATGLRPDLARGRPRDSQRGGVVWGWGGSSADSMVAQPRARTTRFVGVGDLYFLHMRSDGELYGIRPQMWTRVEGHSCMLPVVREN